MDPLLVSPDCRDDNHTKCDGNAWDLILDYVVDCDCPCHQKEETNASMEGS